jgi:hypothetical protein
MFGNPPRTISNWIKKVDETRDLNSLCTKPRSDRRPELNAQQTQEIRQALCEPLKKKELWQIFGMGRVLRGILKTSMFYYIYED